MASGGRRPGAGRPRLFQERAAFPVYIESEELEMVMVFIQFYKDLLGDRSFSTSSLATKLITEWVTSMRSTMSEEYTEWFSENSEWVAENYPLEYANKQRGDTPEE